MRSIIRSLIVYMRGPHRYGTQNCKYGERKVGHIIIYRERNMGLIIICREEFEHNHRVENLYRRLK